LEFKSILISELCEDIGANTEENIEKNQCIPNIYINKLRDISKFNTKSDCFYCKKINGSIKQIWM